MASLSISPAKRADALELLECHEQSRAYHAPWIQPFTTMAGFEEWLEAQVSGSNVGFVARESASGRIVGVTHISQIFMKGFRSAYLSYHGMMGFGGRGLMTEAVRKTVAYAFVEIGLHRLEANIQPGNHRSLALVERIGFRKEGFSPRYLKIGGVWCDHERWALLADEMPEGGA